MAEAERCGIAQAALITGMPKRTLQDLARTIPGASKPAGRWLFVITDLRAWATRINRKAVSCRPKTSIGAVKSGGRVSRSVESSTDKAYERVLNQRRANG